MRSMGALAIYFLDVGQGDCSFVVGPQEEQGERKVVLFDCADSFVALRFILDHNISRIDSVVVSHLDKDHIGGMANLLRFCAMKSIQIGKIHITPDRSRQHLSQAARDLVAVIKETNIPLRPSHLSGDSLVDKICQGKDWRVELVLPHYDDVFGQQTSDRYPNRCSSVLRVFRAGKAVLIGSDAPLASWRRLNKGLLSATVLRVPHHGGNIGTGRSTDWTEEHFYKGVSPEIAAISTGTLNGEGHPMPEHTSAIRKLGTCRIACTQLTSRCCTNPEEHRAEILARVNEVAPAWRHHVKQNEVPCAGSMVVSIDSRGKLSFLPKHPGWHNELIENFESPLCRPPAPIASTATSPSSRHARRSARRRTRTRRGSG